MAKYSREQRDRAVDLYIKYERCAADVIRELGYPSKGVLLSWYADRLEEERTGVPSGRGERYRRYTDGRAMWRIPRSCFPGSRSNPARGGKARSARTCPTIYARGLIPWTKRR